MSCRKGSPLTDHRIDWKEPKNRVVTLPDRASSRQLCVNRGFDARITVFLTQVDA
jgi:hypothetical protein